MFREVTIKHSLQDVLYFVGSEVIVMQKDDRSRLEIAGDCRRHSGSGSFTPILRVKAPHHKSVPDGVQRLKERWPEVAVGRPKETRGFARGFHNAMSGKGNLIHNILPGMEKEQGMIIGMVADGMSAVRCFAYKLGIFFDIAAKKEKCAFDRI